jgi:hypothetical protein
MLDRSKLLQELQAVSSKLFVDNSDQYQRARQIWRELCEDPLFAYAVKEVQIAALLPTWQDQVDARIAVDPCDEYQIISVDGSQIYPDRHQNIACYLINIGTIKLTYGDTASIRSESVPMLFLMNDLLNEQGAVTDLVNCQREEHELQVGFEQGLQLKKVFPEGKRLVLFDGSLIFWHLQEKDETVQERFLSRYLGILEQFYKENILMASYISFSKSKELANLIRAKLVLNGATQESASRAIDMIIDTTVAGFYLEPHERTTLFKNHAAISVHYPDHLKPYFFYLHVGQEIARIEIPAWIAQDEEKVAHVAAMVLDQAIKGRGYPVCLAEAHEQAVVKGPDREFFYYLLQKVGIEQKQRRIISQKSLKKRGMGI